MGGDEKIELSGLRMPSTSTNQPKNKQTDRNVWLKRWVRKKKTTYENFWKERTTNFRICINEWFIQNERVFCAYVAFTPLWACSTCSPHLRVRPLRENKFAPPQNPLTLFLPRNPFLLCRHHNMPKRAKTALKCLAQRRTSATTHPHNVSQKFTTFTSYQGILLKNLFP